MLKKTICKGCGAELYRIKPPFERRSIPVGTEEYFVQQNEVGSWFIRENGTYVCGFPVGESCDTVSNLTTAYKPHLPECPYNGRAIRKPRNRSK